MISRVFPLSCYILRSLQFVCSDYLARIIWAESPKGQPGHHQRKKKNEVKTEGRILNCLPCLGLSLHKRVRDNPYRPVHKKYDSSKLKNFINEKFKKIFNFFTCILPNNVAHDITKEFWKNSHFENMTAVFFWAVKTDFGKLPLK